MDRRAAVAALISLLLISECVCDIGGKLNLLHRQTLFKKEMVSVPVYQIGYFQQVEDHACFVPLVL